MFQNEGAEIKKLYAKEHSIGGSKVSQKSQETGSNRNSIAKQSSDILRAATLHKTRRASIHRKSDSHGSLAHESSSHPIPTAINEEHHEDDEENN